MFRPSSVLCTALLLLQTLANPVEVYDVLEVRAVNCKAVTGILAVVKLLGAPATSFCSSYLNVPASVTQAATITPAPAVVTSTTTPIFENVSCKVTAAPNLKKRSDVFDKRAVPAALVKYAAIEISSACSCLSIKPKATVTKTFTAAGGPTQTSYAAAPTSTVCTGCITNGSPCNVGNAGQCCGQTCICPEYPNCVCAG